MAHIDDRQSVRDGWHAGYGVGERVTVAFNGHPYPGVVTAKSARRLRVRFTTGSGTTRDTWFGYAQRSCVAGFDPPVPASVGRMPCGCPLDSGCTSHHA